MWHSKINIGSNRGLLALLPGLVLLLGLLFAAGCASNPYKKTNRIYKANARAIAKTLRTLPEDPYRIGPDGQPAEAMDWVGAVHFNLRKPSYVMIHHTAQNSLEQTLHTFTVPHSQVSSHYVIGRDGTVVQMLNDYVRGWHAGAGRWGSLTDLNSVTVGIELDNNGFEPFPEEQMVSLLYLLDTLKQKYNIPDWNFLAHSDTAPTRKQDPSVLFPWKRLAEKGFGIWPDEILADPPANFNPIDALRIIGYDVRNLDATIVAFKRRYVQHDISPQLTEQDVRVIYNLYLKL